MAEQLKPVLARDDWPTNGHLIADVARLGYLDGHVLDTTYGLGTFWTIYSPAKFTACDLDPTKSPIGYGVDFRDLPHADASWDTVCFDPPYVPRQGPADATVERDQDFRDRFGLSESRGRDELRSLIDAGLGECARVMRRWLLVKCNDYVNGRGFHLGHHQVLLEAERLGLRCHDLIVHATGTGPGGTQIKTVLRARRAHSYLIVLERKGRRR